MPRCGRKLLNRCSWTCSLTSWLVPARCPRLSSPARESLASARDPPSPRRRMGCSTSRPRTAGPRHDDHAGGRIRLRRTQRAAPGRTQALKHGQEHSRSRTASTVAALWKTSAPSTTTSSAPSVSAPPTASKSSSAPTSPAGTGSARGGDLAPQPPPSRSAERLSPSRADISCEAADQATGHLHGYSSECPTRRPEV